MSNDNSGLIADALRKTQPILYLSMDTNGSFKSWIKSCGAKVSLYRDYERGDHRASITTQMKKMLRLNDDDSGMVDFNDNYMQIVVDKMAGRLRVNEITLGDETQDKGWLAPLLSFNNWAALQGTVFRGAIRDGDSYVMVDPQTLEWTSEPAYDGYSGVFALFYNNACTPYWAVKIWSEASEADQKEVMRVVVYEEDKVSYWRGENGGQELIPDNVILLSDLIRNSQQYNVTIAVPVGVDPNTTRVNYMPWPVSSVPVVHFVNKYDNYSESGESEMRPAIPLQDVLNRTLHSMVMASEFSAFNILWSIGMEIDVSAIQPGAVINLVLKDANGKAITDPTPEMAQFLSAMKVGQFAGSDISQYTNQIDKLVREISQATQTPIYGITTQGAISGEALKQLEIGLIGKCERFQHQNEDAIRDLIKLSADIQTVFQTEYEGTPAPVLNVISVVWKSPEITDVTAQISALVVMRKDAPNLWPDDWYRGKIGGLLGMSQSDVKTEGELAATQQANMLASLTGGDGSVPVV